MMDMTNCMDKFWKYVIIGVLFWVVVDYTTVFNPDFQDWINHMPLIWLFYIGYPLIFAFLIYRKEWISNRIFYSMLVATFSLELVVFNNALLYTVPIMLIMIPIAVCIYSFITFPPKWIVEGTLSENRKPLILLVIVWVIVAVLHFATATN